MLLVCLLLLASQQTWVRPSIVRHGGIWGAADDAVWNNVHKERKKKNLYAFTVNELPDEQPYQGRRYWTFYLGTFYKYITEKKQYNICQKTFEECRIAWRGELYAYADRAYPQIAVRLVAARILTVHILTTFYIFGFFYILEWVGEPCFCHLYLFSTCKEGCAKSSRIRNHKDEKKRHCLKCSLYPTRQTFTVFNIQCPLETLY